ncbi:hypothetical protein [Mucilaginibacter sp. dw_454]|uniref:hypothetical protein n=1 Tax=Mucilaginibacter sp. dw_454 TaxID=2720079 RepID=UPI001BD547C4|nr:hypothetical protein [Mucilaginibacter sp. dw_454]
MKNYFMLKLPLVLLMLVGYLATAQAQDSVKRTVVKKVPATKPVITAKPGSVPINPKTGKPYSRYGYGAYAKTYRAQQKADSLKRLTTTPAKGAASVAAAPVKVAAPVPAAKPDTVATQATPKIDKSLYGQYQYLLTKVYNYQKPFVAAMWKSYTDTLHSVRNQLKAANDKIADQTKTTTGLQADVASKEQALSQTDSISFLGMAFAKGTYNIVMWGLVLIIAIIAGVVISQSGGYRKEAVYRTTLYNELEEEFKTFKAKANEKEKKLARELQTERNKLDELTGRG